MIKRFIRSNHEFKICVCLIKYTDLSMKMVGIVDVIVSRLRGFFTPRREV